MPSQRIVELCASQETVIAAIAANPKQPVTKAAKSLFKNHSHANDVHKDGSELDIAAQCGKFPYRPSDLFLTVSNAYTGFIAATDL